MEAGGRVGRGHFEGGLLDVLLLHLLQDMLRPLQPRLRSRFRASGFGYRESDFGPEFRFRVWG